MLGYTTDTPAVENVLSQVKNDLDSYFKDRNPAKIEGFLDFYEELLKHIEAETFLEN